MVPLWHNRKINLSNQSQNQDLLLAYLASVLVTRSSSLQVGVTLSRLASVQRELDQLDESIKSLQEAKNKFGNNDEYNAVIFSKLSVVHRYRGEDEISMQFAKKAISITEKNQKHKIPGHPGKSLLEQMDAE